MLAAKESTFDPDTHPFEAEILGLSRELETWRAEVRAAADAAPDEFPPFDRKAGMQAFLFFIFFLLASYLFPFVQRGPSRAAQLLVVLPMLISLSAAPILFVFGAMGLAQAKFWRAVLYIFKRRPDNYPFTSLHNCLDHDLRQQARLGKYSAHVLVAAEHRISQEEGELRERLNAIIGTPTIFVILGALAGVLTAWENYHTKLGSPVGGTIFAVSIITLLVGFWGLRLRIALTELSRCRALLSLEIARRSAGEQGSQRQRRSRRRRKLRSK